MYGELADILAEPSSIAGLPGIQNGAVACADYNNDGRVDLLLAGATNFATSTVAGVS